MVSVLTTEGIVFDKPVVKIAPNGLEYLSVTIGLFDIKETGPQTFSKLECTLWSNPNLLKRIVEMGVEIRDRVLVTGKFTIKKVYGRNRMRLYIHDFVLLSKGTMSAKNTEHELINIDDSLINNVEVFNTEPVKVVDYEALDNKEIVTSSEEF